MTHQVVRYVSRTRFEELVRELEASSRFTSYDYQDARELGMSMQEYQHRPSRRVTQIMMLERAGNGGLVEVIYREAPHA